MTLRNPIVLISGTFSQLPPGDSVAGATASILPDPSGLYSSAGALGIDGSAQASGNAGIELALTKATPTEVIGLIIALS